MRTTFIEKKENLGALFSIPFLVLVIIFFLVPLFLVVWFSFMPPRTFTLFQLPTLENFHVVFSQSYVRSLGWSISLAFLTVVILLLICYPLAFAMAKVFRGATTFLTYGIAASLFIPENIRLFGWVIGLMKNGVIVGSLKYLGFQEVDSLLYNIPVILLGMCYVYLPFMLFPLVLGIKMIPDQVREAAYDLGASRWQVFREIDFPLSLPGVMIGSVLVFVLSIGAIAEAKILGGQSIVVIAADIETEFTYGQNWPLGSALATLLLFVTFILVFTVLDRLNIEKFLGKNRTK